MDVALDANAILNDPQMQGNAFNSLLDYLKKTNSKLVLSKVVLDEVIARYPERLRKANRNARAAVGALNSLLFDAKINFPAIDEKVETRKLKQKLLEPSQHVKSLIIENFAEIKIEEVVKRGIERVPPANGAGEELRDVIHWLMLLAHARTSKQEIAFISNDGHFRQEAAFHPLLEKDVRENEVGLHFYASFDQFIKAHAPAPLQLTEADAFGYIGKSHVMDRFETEARGVFRANWPTASSISLVQRDVQLVGGALYNVGPDSQFGELEFSGTLEVLVTTEMVTINPYPGNYPWLPELDSVYPSLIGYGANALAERAAESKPHSTGLLGIPQLFGPSGETLLGSMFVTRENAFKIPNTFASPQFASPSATVNKFRLAGGLVLSIRVVSEKVVKIETERFQLGKIERID